jgi:hypothetical protein
VAVTNEGSLALERCADRELAAVFIPEPLPSSVLARDHTHDINISRVEEHKIFEGSQSEASRAS